MLFWRHCGLKLKYHLVFSEGFQKAFSSCFFTMSSANLWLCDKLCSLFFFLNDFFCFSLVSIWAYLTVLPFSGKRVPVFPHSQVILLHNTFYILIFLFFYCEKWIRFGEIIILPAVPKVWQVLPNSFYTAPFSCSSLLFKVWCFLLLSTLLLSSLFFKLLCCFLITGPVLLDSALKLFK